VVSAGREGGGEREREQGENARGRERGEGMKRSLNPKITSVNIGAMFSPNIGWFNPSTITPPPCHVQIIRW
jgi:hypothetical protein